MSNPVFALSVVTLNIIFYCDNDMALSLRGNHLRLCLQNEQKQNQKHR